MEVAIQRVSQAQVAIKEQMVGQIKQGFMVLVGIHQEDTPEDVAHVVGKISELCVFEDDEGKMNRNIQEIEGSILSIPQFTLYAKTKKGNRLSSVEVARPDMATPLYRLLNQQLEVEGTTAATRGSGVDM